MKYSVKYKTDTSLIDRMLEEIGKHDPLPDIEDKSTPIKVELKPHIYYVDCANLGEEGNDKYIPERHLQPTCYNLFLSRRREDCFKVHRRRRV